MSALGTFSGKRRRRTINFFPHYPKRRRVMRYGPVWRMGREIVAASNREAFARGRSRTSGYYGRYKYGLSATNPEMKFFDGAGTLGGADINTAGNIAEDSLHHVAAGTGEQNRVGRKISLRKIHIRGTYVLTPATDQTKCSAIVRTIVYLDKQCNGSAATVTDILESAAWHSFNNLANKSRFRILLDRKTKVRSEAGAYDGTDDQYGINQNMYEWHINVNLPIEFNSTTGAIGEIRSNNVGLLMITNGSARVTTDYKWRVRFFDC